MYLLFTLLIILYFIFLLLIKKEYFIPKTQKTERKYIPQIGDLIFFSGKTFGEKLIRFFTQSEWSHVAIVIAILNDDAIVYELDVSHKNKGARVTTIKKKLERKNYSPIIGVRSLRKKITPESEMHKKLINDIKYKHLSTKLDESFVRWFLPSSIAKIFRGHSQFCSEKICDVSQTLTGAALQDCINLSPSIVSENFLKNEYTSTENYII